MNLNLQLCFNGRKADAHSYIKYIDNLFMSESYERIFWARLSMQLFGIHRFQNPQYFSMMLMWVPLVVASDSTMNEIFSLIFKRQLMRQEQCHEVSAQLLPERPALQDVLPVSGSALQEGQTQVAHHQRDAHRRVCLRSQVCEC
jgi:hypothetical protein